MRRTYTTKANANATAEVYIFLYNGHDIGLSGSIQDKARSGESELAVMHCLPLCSSILLSCLLLRMASYELSIAYVLSLKLSFIIAGFGGVC